MIASEPATIPALDGRPLAATVFRPAPPAEARRALVICPAMGVPRDHYFDFAEHAAERGHAVVAFDYRGIGGSAPRDGLRGFDADLLDWGERDVPGVVARTRELFPGREVTLVAHSIGGELAGLAHGAGAEVAGLIAVGAQTGWWGHWHGARRAQVAFLWYVGIPALTRLLGYFPSRSFGIGRPLPAGVARQWAHWGRHPDHLRGRLPADRTAGHRRFPAPVSLTTATDDWLAPESAVRDLASYYESASPTVEVVAPAALGLASIGHFGYFSLRVGPPLWDRLLAHLPP